MSASFLKMLIDDVIGALQGGSFDARDDRHVSWTPGVVDEQAWGELTKLLEETLKRIISIQTKAAARLAKSGKEGIPVTVAMLGYEGLAPDVKARKTNKKAKKASKKA
jgi:1-deoxy-D-xylulose 5-phosphate reductoisomerase